MIIKKLKFPTNKHNFSFTLLINKFKKSSIIMKNYIRNFFDILMFFTLLTIVLISFDFIDGKYVTFFYVGMIVCPVYWLVEYLFEKKDNK